MKVNLPLSAEVVEYIQNRLAGDEYENLRAKAKEISNGKAAEITLPIDFQDAYLSSGILPSNTGRLGKDETHRMPPLLASLGFCRQENYSTLVRGRLLFVLMSPNELLAFEKYNASCNPFLLDTRQKILFAYQFIEHDGDAIRVLYDKLPLDKTFTDREVGDHMAEVYRDITEFYRPKTQSASDNERLQRLRNLALSIEKWKGKSDTGSKNPRTHNAAIRLEPLVDIGLLAKDAPHLFKYSISRPSKLFFEALYKSSSIQDFLHNEFFENLNVALGFEAKKIMNKAQILKEYYNACQTLKSPLGYSPIEDAAILAGINGLTQEGHFFEIAEVMEVIKDYQKKYPNSVRFNINRSGEFIYVKFIGQLNLDSDHTD
jgi:hypothetical protein